MRRKRCIFCGNLNTRKHDKRTKKRATSFGKRECCYQRWFCKSCNRAFKPDEGHSINFSLKVKACELYYDRESSYRAVGRQLRIAPYRVFQIINALGANCKSTIEMARELNPHWSGYLFIDEKCIWIKGDEWYLLIAVDLGTQDIVHWDLVSREDEVNVAWFLIIIKMVIKYPFKGLISDLAEVFYATTRWLLAGIPHQFCTYHAYNITEYYFKYRYTVGGHTLWVQRFLTVTRIICRCNKFETALRALDYLEHHQDEIKKAKLIKRMNILRLRFPYLVRRFKDPNLKPDNNIIENVIRQLNQKLKKIAGFQSYQTAHNSLSLLVMRYRFHKFDCSRIPGNNRKSPLVLAGVNTSTMNWVRFSQKTKRAHNTKKI
ncbi:MAG: transposase [Gemmatimonadota bacterium]|nr:MAG: transposase [Gemmatimonadota bacterium]